MNKPIVASTLVAAIVLCGAGAAQAQVAGQILVKAGWNRISPKVQSGDLSPPAIPGSQIGVKPASSLLLSATYMYTDAFSLEILGGLPYKHDVVGAGAVSGTGKLGSEHQISPTLLFQYRFMQADAAFRPYVGAGPTYAKFYDTDGSATLTALTNPGGPPTTIRGSTAWGGTVEAGLSYKIDKHWFVDAAVLKTWISTSTHLSSGQDISVDLNPVSVNVSAGYAF
jgi:outer membrane protein